jgi:hypothetical protein
MSASGDAPLRSESGKGSGGAGRNSALAVAARSPRRSSLFWWLFDNHDGLVEASAPGALGISWKAMCPVFTELNLTLAEGVPITPERARQTWWRVRKEKARRRALEAAAQAEQAIRRAQDPRRNMPSRMSGKYEAPLAEVTPRRAIVEPRQIRPVEKASPSTLGEASTDPSLIVMFQGETLDLNLFVCAGVKEPWEDSEFSHEEQHRIKVAMLKLRFENWKTERVLDPNNRVDRERKRRNAIRNS